jgi:hypothetical protein
MSKAQDAAKSTEGIVRDAAKVGADLARFSSRKRRSTKTKNGSRGIPPSRSQNDAKLPRQPENSDNTSAGGGELTR